MELATAVTGGTLATSLNDISAKLTRLNTAIDNSAVIAGGNITISDPVTGAATIPLSALTSNESATVFNSMKDILTTRQTTLQGQLAAL